VAITLLLKERGIEPKAVTGHSVGEIAAAWAAGALDLNNAIRVICARSQAQGLTRGTGRMAAVGMSAERAREMLAALGSDLDVELAGSKSGQCLRSPDSLDGLILNQQHVEPKGTYFRLLDLDYAFHTAGRWIRCAKSLSMTWRGCRPDRRTKRFIVSTVTGGVFDGKQLVPDYWWRNVREPVRFAEAIATLAEHGCSRVLSTISPHAILQRYVGECLNAAVYQGARHPHVAQRGRRLDRIADTTLRVQLL
jgi:acyl transferase domain-containing protein